MHDLDVDYRHQLSLLTKLHADVLVWILLPQLLIRICITHEGENHILNDALQKKKKKERVSIKNG